MAYFEQLDYILNSATSMLLTNQNLCKLLYYYPEKVNLQYNPMTQPDVQHPEKLLLTNIFPLPKIPDADTKQNCLICVTLTGGQRPTKNSGFIEVLLSFDIMCHLDSWIIKNGFRPNRILMEIDKMFNNQNTLLHTINKPQPLPFVTKDYTNRFYGYHISYRLQLDSNIVCGING